MPRFLLSFKTSFGEVTIEAESINDLRNSLSDLAIDEPSIDKILEEIRQKIGSLPALPRPSIVSVAPSKPELRDIVEFKSDGTPHIAVQPTKLTGREVIGLLLYAKGPNSISMRELNSLINDNWRSISIQATSAYINNMRVFIIKEGTRGSYTYRLSGSGRNWVENELLPKLRSDTS